MPHKLARARARLRRHLAAGWQRAVFSTPQGADERSRVIEGPGVLAPGTDPGAFDRVFADACAAADEGLVKQVFVIDPSRRIVVDARHGWAKAHTRDAQTVRKVMGGKDRPLRPDRDAPLLQAIGIMRPDGTISTRHARKYKQVNHLVELCRPVVDRLLRERTPTAAEPLRIADLACGNGYVAFVLAETLAAAQVPFRVLGVDVRPDVIDRCEARAAQLGWRDRMHFTVASIAHAAPIARTALGGAPELVLALHACDTASDEAIAFAIQAASIALLVAPCCHAELARQLLSSRPALESPALLEHGLLRRGFADTLTDALRAELLELSGYEVGVLEFVPSEHTPKNLLLRALRADAPPDPAVTLQALVGRCAALGVRPRLVELLGGAAPRAD
jgi:SAM-dependent methyltransferase